MPEHHMTNELEVHFGQALQQLVAHLIKNADQVPATVLQGALDFETLVWEKLDDDAKRARLRIIAAETEAPSIVSRHLDAYPHPFTKKRYADYLEALRLYKKSLNA
jgi:hypothetical protein